MFKKTLLLSSTLVAIALTPAAFASDKDTRIEALETQMQAMFEEIQRLKTEQTTEKEQQASLQQEIRSLKETAETTQAQLANVEPAAGGSGKIGDIRELRKGDFSLKPFGRIQLDAASFDDDASDNPDGAEFRRLRLGVKGDLPGDFGYKVQIGFDGDNTDIEDAYISYNGVQNTKFTLGNHKPYIGLEELNSSKDTALLERASASDAFAPGRAIGLSGSTHGDRWTASAGVFNDDPGTSSSDDEAFSVSGRLTGLPVKTDNAIVHLGGSVDYRSPDRANNSFNFDANAENSIQTQDTVSVTVNNADSATIYGLEAAAVLGPVSAQAEYFTADVDTFSGPSPRFDGAYGQVAWVVTGESRPYKTSTGLIGRPKPKNPLNPANGDWGALELAARYSTLDLSDEGFNGGELDTVTLGANWYPNNYLRFSGNYIISDSDENAVVADDDPNIFLVRAQAAF